MLTFLEIFPDRPRLQKVARILPRAPLHVPVTLSVTNQFPFGITGKAFSI